MSFRDPTLRAAASQTRVTALLQLCGPSAEGQSAKHQSESLDSNTDLLKADRSDSERRASVEKQEDKTMSSGQAGCDPAASEIWTGGGHFRRGPSRKSRSV
eukprot:3239889-Heterocapsa_arctica.AAC.1